MVMGNVRGGKDGEGPSGTKSYGAQANFEGFLGSSQDWVFSQPMSQSPNHNSPGTFQPHLFFDSTHNLIAPLQRPEEPILPQNQAFLQNPMNNENHAGPSEILTQVRLSWSRGGNQVAVTGSWDNWATRDQLHSTGDSFYVVKALPPGEYHYLFIVDGYLRCAPDLPWVFDASGNAYNVLDLQQCNSELPEHLSEFETPPSPPSSYNNEFLSEDDYSRPPPETPPQLQATILNEPLSSDGQQPLPQPQHLNHLYIQSHVEGRFIALGSTRRFHEKYVTMVLYKPLR